MASGKLDVVILNNKADGPQKNTESKNLCLHRDGSPSRDVLTANLTWLEWLWNTMRAHMRCEAWKYKNTWRYNKPLLLFLVFTVQNHWCYWNSI